jgi:hypothetical protein
MRRAGFSKIDLEVFGISVVITVLFVHWGGWRLIVSQQSPGQFWTS